MWSSHEHGEREAHELPEVKRLDLAEVVLTLKAAGVADLRKFRWLEAPTETALAHAEELLMDLGAIRPVGGGARLRSAAVPAAGSGGVSPRERTWGGTPQEPAGEDARATEITELGRRMLAFPVHPRYARMLLAAQEYKCVYQACLVAALTQGRDLLIRRAGKETGQARDDLFGEEAASDFFILMRAWNYAAKSNFNLDACRRMGIHAITARQVGPLHQQFLRIAADEGLDARPAPMAEVALQKCILIGFSDRVARRLDQGTLRCELVHGRRGTLARESAVQRSPFFVAAEVHEIEGAERSVNTLLSLATAVEPEWLRELFPDDIRAGATRVSYDAVAKRVGAEEQVCFRDLVLSSRRLDTPPADAAARLLAEEVIAGRLELKNWDASVDQWIIRLNRLRQWCPELQLPAVTEDDRRMLIEQVCHGAASSKDIKDREVKSVVQSWLSSAQQALLDKHAPERLALSTERNPKVTYVADGPPFVALRIQQLYGVTKTPCVAMGRVPVLLHILAPNMRAVQITQDLAGFWREHYPRIKSEMQRKYPKHEWR